jgi:hypothetical protein
VIGLLAAIQDKIGAAFGIPGGLVVAIAIFGGLALASDASEKNKENDEKRAVRTGDGVFASNRKAGPTARSQLCADGRHDKCASRVRLTDGTIRDCTCTCHAVAMTRFCGELSRHDLCPGAVVLGNVGAADCGCTCHRRATSLPRGQLKT